MEGNPTYHEGQDGTYNNQSLNNDQDGDISGTLFWFFIFTTSAFISQFVRKCYTTNCRQESQRIITELKKPILLTSVVYRSDENERDECSICLEKFNIDEEVFKTPCNHMFHVTCLTEWLYKNKTCPICRYDL